MSDTQTEAPTIATDSRGRKLAIKRLDLQSELDLIEMAGDASANARWMTIVSIAATVREVDTVPVPFPRDRNGLKALIARVGSEGLAAAVETLRLSLPEEAPDQMEVAKN